MIPRSPIGYLLGEPLQEWLGQNITKVVDLCAGVGCLGILAAQRYPQAHVTLVELDARAARLARKMSPCTALATASTSCRAMPVSGWQNRPGQWDLI